MAKKVVKMPKKVVNMPKGLMNLKEIMTESVPKGKKVAVKIKGKKKY